MDFLLAIGSDPVLRLRLGNRLLPDEAAPPPAVEPPNSDMFAKEDVDDVEVNKKCRQVTLKVRKVALQ